MSRKTYPFRNRKEYNQYLIKRGSITELLKLDKPAPDYTTLSKRKRGLHIPLAQDMHRGEGLQLMVDSTGLKVFGEGEWGTHGITKKHLWRKLPLAIRELTDLGNQVMTHLGIPQTIAD